RQFARALLVAGRQGTPGSPENARREILRRHARGTNPAHALPARMRAPRRRIEKVDDVGAMRRANQTLDARCRRYLRVQTVTVTEVTARSCSMYETVTNACNPANRHGVVTRRLSFALAPPAPQIGGHLCALLSCSQVRERKRQGWARRGRTIPRGK